MSQSKLLEIGDIHGEAEEVVDDILDNYDSGDLDGVVFVGDATNMPGKYSEEASTSDVVGGLTSEVILDEQYGHLERLGEELDLSIYSLPGNHEDRLEGVYQEVVNSYKHVEDASYDSIDIGDHTVVGFGSHESREKPVGGFDSEPEGSESAEDETYEEVSEDTSSKATPSDLITGPPSAMGSMIGSMLGFGGSSSSSSTNDTEETEENYDEENDTENAEEDPRKQIYEGKYDRIDQLLTDAGDDAVLLHHSVPDAAELEGSKMGYVNDQVGYQGSVIGTEMLEKHNLSAYLGGHHHGQEREEIFGTEVLNPGADNYYEVTLEEDGVADAKHYQTDIWEPDYSAQVERVSEQVDELAGNRLNQIIERLPDQIIEELPWELRDSIESGEIDPKQALEEIQRHMTQRMAEQPEQPQQAPSAGPGHGPAQAGA